MAPAIWWKSRMRFGSKFGLGYGFGLGFGGRRGTTPAPGKWKVVGYVFSSRAKICLKTPKVVLLQLLCSVHLSTPAPKKRDATWNDSTKHYSSSSSSSP